MSHGNVAYLMTQFFPFTRARYGYQYSCQELMGTMCQLRAQPFHGAPCSDAVGVQVSYGTLRAWNATALWDTMSQSPYFTIGTRQIWYDDPQSLCLKASLVSKYKLGGIGMWNAELLNYNDSVEAQAMWESLIQRHDIAMD